ncbi:MAG: hypothetical protein Q4G07_06000 [Oscillospiraceae bacterium]|nr:hypothetical protein [Oscillospiraceae bacterium]
MSIKGLGVRFNIWAARAGSVSSRHDFISSDGSAVDVDSIGTPLPFEFWPGRLWLIAYFADRDLCRQSTQCRKEIARRQAFFVLQMYLAADTSLFIFTCFSCFQNNI